MKIPETSANVGAYYGNEENGQWQPNGVIIDTGVGGGIVGSGDAGIHRPPVYPVHLPRGHMPGYVMAGAYYPPAAYPPVPAPPQDDFADYMWMENEEEFDKQVMQQLEEEALMEQCIEAMLEDEQRERHNRPTANGHNHHYPTTSNGTSLSLEETVSRSTLNPLAAEFVPTRVRPSTTEEKQDTVDASATEQPAQKTEEVPTEQSPPTDKIEDEQHKTEEPVPPQKDPPEVSAADVLPIDRSQRPTIKEAKKEPSTKKEETKVEAKKPTKPEVKPKVKPLPIKSETKIQPKKKEVKVVKSDTKTEDSRPDETVLETSKPQPTPVEETQAPSGFKPINYAAAAKANKPKKPAPATPTPTTPTAEKQAPKIEKTDKKVVKLDKLPLKSEKIAQRKNSAK